jgi:hypothetical protein
MGWGRQGGGWNIRGWWFDILSVLMVGGGVGLSRWLRGGGLGDGSTEYRLGGRTQ